MQLRSCRSHTPPRVIGPPESRYGGLCGPAPGLPPLAPPKTGVPLPRRLDFRAPNLIQCISAADPSLRPGVLLLWGEDSSREPKSCGLSASKRGAAHGGFCMGKAGFQTSVQHGSSAFCTPSFWTRSRSCRSHTPSRVIGPPESKYGDLCGPAPALPPGALPKTGVGLPRKLDFRVPDAIQCISAADHSLRAGVVHL